MKAKGLPLRGVCHGVVDGDKNDTRPVTAPTPIQAPSTFLLLPRTDPLPYSSHVDPSLSLYGHPLHRKQYYSTPEQLWS